MSFAEGIFYADDLPVNELQVLEKYAKTAISDVKSFPPEFPSCCRSEFMRKVFLAVHQVQGCSYLWPKPSVRSRQVSCWLGTGVITKRMVTHHGAISRWSRKPDYRPRVLITPIDSKKAFIRFGKSGGNQKNGSKTAGHISWTSERSPGRCSIVPIR